MGTIEVKDDIFLERKAELSIFDRFISSSDEDKTKMLLISGERGIGKTHLLKNIGPEIEKKGFVYLQGKCYDTNSDPYLPLREAFDQYENKTEEVEEDGLIFSNILAEEPIRKDLKIFDREKRTIFYQSVKEIKKIVKEIPIFISLDDLHWSDELTLKMLHYLS